ncbi:hypothetical protein, partial [Streptomyces ossamyceticus]|uniref:hypothetical protein n=1 Tax=Streptomyces ossamyceticus TaxID=249581 RepID=UPI003B8A8DF9
MAGWVRLAPIQRAAVRDAAVADTGFGGRLTTWQNPSFTGALSHAVLPDAPSGLVKDVLTVSARPTSGLELPSLTLPVARADAEPPGRGPGFGTAGAALDAYDSTYGAPTSAA